MGGIIAGGFSIAPLVPWSTHLVAAIAALAMIAGVSLWDDRYGASVASRLFLQFVASLLVLMGLDLDSTMTMTPSWLTNGIAIAYLLWMINLYNFMDGMDGLAGGMAVLGFTFIAILGWQAQTPLYAVAASIVAASSLGFLIFNFAPARIFMGDVGSASLGLLAGVFSLAGTRIDAFPLWAAVLVFSPFIVDATLTLIRRLLRGEPVWQAHRTHYYQRLAQAGWGHRKTAIYAYGLMLACGLSALFAVHLQPKGQVLVLATWVLIYGVLARWIDIRTR